MNTPSTIELIRSDLYRLEGKVGAPVFLRHFVREIGFRYMVFFRLTQWRARQSCLMRLLTFPIFYLRRRMAFKYGILIPTSTNIGPGFYIGYFGGIVVTGGATIGRDCNISYGVGIGRTNRGQRMGCPTIGDRVYIGPGAKIIGKVIVGSDVAIGANAVVTRDVPDGAVVAGIPARIIGDGGSQGYVNRGGYGSN